MPTGKGHKYLDQYIIDALYLANDPSSANVFATYSDLESISGAVTGGYVPLSGTVGVCGAIAPYTYNGVDLGTSLLPWRAIHTGHLILHGHDKGPAELAKFHPSIDDASGNVLYNFGTANILYAADFMKFLINRDPILNIDHDGVITTKESINGITAHPRPGDILVGTGLSSDGLGASAWTTVSSGFFASSGHMHNYVPYTGASADIELVSRQLSVTDGNSVIASISTSGVYGTTGTFNDLLIQSGFLYSADSITNGSWRIGVDGDNYVFQRLEDGDWLTKAEIVPDIYGSSGTIDIALVPYIGATSGLNMGTNNVSAAYFYGSALYLTDLPSGGGSSSTTYNLIAAGNLSVMNNITVPVFSTASGTISKIEFELTGEPPVGGSATFNVRRNGKLLFATGVDLPTISGGLVIDDCDFVEEWVCDGDGVVDVESAVQGDSLQYQGNDALVISTVSGDNLFYSIVHNRATLTGGSGALSEASAWAAIADGEFGITLDGAQAQVGPIDFSAVTSMDDVAAAISTAIAVNWDNRVEWVNDHFVISSVATSATAEISAATSAQTYTDISGVGFMDCSDNGVATPWSTGSLDLTQYKYIYVSTRTDNTARQEYYFFVSDGVNAAYWDINSDVKTWWNRVRLPIAYPDSMTEGGPDFTAITSYGLKTLPANEYVCIDYIVAGEPGASATPSITGVRDGDVFSVDCLSIGSTTPGADLIVRITT